MPPREGIPRLGVDQGKFSARQARQVEQMYQGREFGYRPRAKTPSRLETLARAERSTAREISKRVGKAATSGAARTAGRVATKAAGPLSIGLEAGLIWHPIIKEMMERKSRLELHRRIKAHTRKGYSPGAAAASLIREGSSPRKAFEHLELIRDKMKKKRR